MSPTLVSPRLMGAFVPRGVRCFLGRALVGVVLAAAASPALAGSGVVNNNGTIDITVNLRFPPAPADLTNVQNQVIAASGVLWDASEGQLRFGNVTLSCGSVNEDLADMWVFPQAGRAGFLRQSIAQSVPECLGVSQHPRESENFGPETSRDLHF